MCLYGFFKDDSIRKLPSKVRNFGLSFAIKDMLFKKISILTDYRIIKHQKNVYDYLCNFFDSITLDSKDSKLSKDTNNKIPVWVMWWQGLDSAPEIVKICLRSQKEYLSNDVFEYTLLTKDNYLNYVTLPRVIIEKFDKGYITVTHLSDIIRALLLNEYGGLWMDATILMTDHFKEEFYQHKLYTNKKFTYPNIIRNTVPKGLWTGYFMKGPSNHCLFSFMCKAFELYWNEYDTLIDYYLIDYIIKYAYENIECVHHDLDDVPENNPYIFYVVKSMNHAYVSSLFSEIKETTVIHKTARQNTYCDVENGKPTLYSYLKSVYKIND